MMKPDDPRDLATNLLARSTCSVQVAAVIADHQGIFGWGWNSVGKGFGEHAEAAAIRRSNKKRLVGATIYVASQRNRNKKIINSMPCWDCGKLLQKNHLSEVYYTVGKGIWEVADVDGLA